MRFSGVNKKSSNPAPKRRISRLLWLVLAFCAAAATALSGGAILGVGIERGLPALMSAVVAVVSVLLPAQALRPLLGGSWRGRSAALLLWAGAVLLILPLYVTDFPGAARSGFSFILTPAGSSLSEQGSKLAYEISRRLVDGGRAPLPLAVEFPDPGADSTDSEVEPDLPESGSFPEEDSSQDPGDTDHSVVLPVGGRGTSLKVVVLVEGEVGPREIELLFDTGATLTTLDRKTLAELGIPIPRDSPVAVLQTANGPVESPVVLVDRLWLGHIPVENVSVAVCDPCAQDSSRGLLGLNVTGLFDVTFKTGEEELRLDPAAVDGDRTLDVRHWLQMSASVTMWRMGRIEVVVEAENRAPLEVSEVVVELACGDRSFAVQLDDVPAEGSATTELELPRGTDCRRYQVALRSARW
jgi:clan AA aspartic protease (TIGR02281 family)